MNYAQRACLILRDEPKKEEGNLLMVGSDETVDRYNSIIRVSGWQLDNFLKNPVFLWCHNSWDLPVGRAVDVKKDTRRKQLIFELAFPSKETYDFGNIVGRMYAENFLNASSVGFEPLKSSRLEDPKEAKEAGFDTPTGLVYEKQELYELSAVPVPGNPNALKKEFDALSQRCAFKLPEIKEETLMENWWKEAFSNLRGAIERTRWAPAPVTLLDGSKKMDVVPPTPEDPPAPPEPKPEARELTPDDQGLLKNVFASISGAQDALAQAREQVERMIAGTPQDDEDEKSIATKGDINRVLESVETITGSLQKLAVGQGSAPALKPASSSAAILEEGPLAERLSKIADNFPTGKK